jgi:hypothetical protein
MYRIDDTRMLNISGPATAPQAKFRQDMDRLIRRYKMNDPLIYHVTNHPKSAPQRESIPIRPHTKPLGYEQ